MRADVPGECSERSHGDILRPARVPGRVDDYGSDLHLADRQRRVRLAGHLHRRTGGGLAKSGGRRTRARCHDIAPALACRSQSHVDLQPNGHAPIAPSAIKAEVRALLASGPAIGSMPRAIELSEIPGLVDEYRRAAQRAKEAGFDGVRGARC